MEEKTRLSEIEKDNTHLKELPNFQSYADALENEAFMWHPEKQEWRKRFIFKLTKYFKDNPKALRLQDFCEATNYRITKIKNFFIEHEDIKEAWEEIRSQLGNKRFRGFVGAEENFKNGNNLWKDIHLYDDEFHKVNQYHQDLKLEEIKRNEEHKILITARAAHIKAEVEKSGSE